MNINIKLNYSKVQLNITKTPQKCKAKLVVFCLDFLYYTREVRKV